MAGLTPHFLRDSLVPYRLRTSLLVKARRRVLPVDGQPASVVVRETVWSPMHLRGQRRARSSMARKRVTKSDDSYLGCLCPTPL